jgi:hypothetical protein
MQNFIEDKELYPFKIQLDEHCYILIKEVFSDSNHHLSKGKSKPKDIVLGYYTNLSSLINFIVHNQTGEKSYDSIKEYYNEFLKKQQKLTNLITI